MASSKARSCDATITQPCQPWRICSSCSTVAMSKSLVGCRATAGISSGSTEHAAHMTDRSSLHEPRPAAARLDGWQGRHPAEDGVSHPQKEPQPAHMQLTSA